jgi:hypothetical protein
MQRSADDKSGRISKNRVGVQSNLQNVRRSNTVKERDRNSRHPIRIITRTAILTTLQNETCTLIKSEKTEIVVWWKSSRDAHVVLPNSFCIESNSIKEMSSLAREGVCKMNVFLSFSIESCHVSKECLTTSHLHHCLQVHFTLFRWSMKWNGDVVSSLNVCNWKGCYANNLSDTQSVFKVRDQ